MEHSLTVLAHREHRLSKGIQVSFLRPNIVPRAESVELDLHVLIWSDLLLCGGHWVSATRTHVPEVGNWVSQSLLTQSLSKGVTHI